ncbi:FAD-dependent oxidoreductase [soil metagenome]
MVVPYPLLFSPIRFGRIDLPNRLIMTGMAGHMAPPDGSVTDREIAFYERRARGGVGLAVVGAAYVHPGGRFSNDQLGIHVDAHIEGYRRLATAIKRHGAIASIQLHHAGRQTNSRVTGERLLAPSAVACPVKQEVPHALNHEEIAEVVEWFGQGARRVCEAGFDAVELHCAHGYLPAQFLSPRANRRTDEYGGSLERRFRFVGELVARVKREIGDRPLSVKISGHEFDDEGGLTLEETPIIARMLQAAGVDLIAISAGTAPYYMTVPNMSLPRGCYVDLARAVKQRVSVPVSAVGRITTPELAEAILAAGDADLISMGRPLIADPDLPNKALHGQREDVIVCIGCNKGCHDPGRVDRATACLLNAETGFELELGLEPAAVRQKVFVIGGGPGGLEAARVAAVRGHDVSLYEREGYWGGRLHLGTLAPDKQEYQVGIDGLVAQCRKHGVAMHAGVEVTPAMVAAAAPDVVVVATGAEPVVPPIPGLDQSHVVLADQYLQGRATIGHRVVVLGGGAVGSEVAHMLAEQGRHVTVVEMLENWGHGMPPDAKWHMQRHFAHLPIDIHLTTRVLRVEGNTIVAEHDGQPVTWTDVETIVVCAGARPNQTLIEAVRAVVSCVEVIGDAVRPRSGLEAIAEGYRVGRLIGGTVPVVGVIQAAH